MNSTEDNINCKLSDAGRCGAGEGQGDISRSFVGGRGDEIGGLELDIVSGSNKGREGGSVSEDSMDSIPGRVMELGLAEFAGEEVVPEWVDCFGAVRAPWAVAPREEGEPKLPSKDCLLYTSPSPRDGATSRMPSSA